MQVKVPVEWLREYVEVVVPLGELARTLTMAGIETQVRNERAADWSHIWVARVAKLERHPNADRLQLATVDYGHGTKRVVTGATNLAEGDVVPYAEVGASLIDGHSGERTTLEPRSLRGVRSEGMVCSAKELGLGEDHEGILILDRALPVGAPLADALGESVLECELQPNRPDCLGILGIAREVAALLGMPLREPPIAPPLPAPPSDFRVVVEDPAGAPRYDVALLRAARVGPSPEWMRRRLSAAGLRPINNVVDVTNYVMLELGQPMHAFDRRRLAGDTIRVRRAARGEHLRTLDDVERTLDPSVLVIADAKRPVGLAGVIGGENSEIADDTTDLALEVAKFENRGIGRTAMRLALWTDAARHFSWDLSPDMVPFAMRRATLLLRETAGAETFAAVDSYPRRRETPNIRMPFGTFARLLGVELPRDEVLDALRRIGCRYALDGDNLVVTPPAWRTDLAIPEDVVEEAARIVGYERIPTHIPDGPLPLHERHPLEEFRERLRDALVGLGLQEIMSYSLIDPKWLDLLTPDGAPLGPAPMRVTNPLSADQAVARTLLEPSLLDTARRNLRYVDGVALFEIDPVYLPRPRDLPEERWTVGIVLAGRELPSDATRHWLEGEARDFDFFDLKGIVEAALAAVRTDLPAGTAGSPGLHPGRSVEVRDGDRIVARMGQLDPRVAERWELPAATQIAVLDLATLLGRARPTEAELPSRFPPADRDLAVVVGEDVAWATVADSVRASAGKRLRELDLLDVYRGAQIPEGKKSFAMHLVFVSEEGTLAEAEIERLLRRIAGRLEHSFGATVRE